MFPASPITATGDRPLALNSKYHAGFHSTQLHPSYRTAVRPTPTHVTCSLAFTAPNMMMSGHEDAFYATGPLWGKPTSKQLTSHRTVRKCIVLMFLVSVWIFWWTNSRVAGDFRRHEAYVTVMATQYWLPYLSIKTTNYFHCCHISVIVCVRWFCCHIVKVGVYQYWRIYFPLLLCSLWCVKTTGYIMFLRTYLLVGILHHHYAGLSQNIEHIIHVFVMCFCQVYV